MWKIKTIKKSLLVCKWVHIGTCCVRDNTCVCVTNILQLILYLVYTIHLNSCTDLQYTSCVILLSFNSNRSTQHVPSRGVAGESGWVLLGVMTRLCSNYIFVNKKHLLTTEVGPCCHSLFCFVFVLAAPHSLRDLSSLTRDWAQALVESPES